MRKLAMVLTGIFCFAGIIFAGDNKITAVPLFQSCGIYFEASDISIPCTTEFKEKGTEKWNRAFELVAIEGKILELNAWKLPPYTDKTMFRGSIVNLKEDTEYELRIRQGSNTYTTEFKTWNSNPPIAKKLNVRDLAFDNELVISEKGTKDGWIKYTAPEGFVLKGDNHKKAVITVKNGEYIIIENLKIEGGAYNGISLENSQNIRILNCDISGYGRIGKQDLTKDGKYYQNEKTFINYDSGVNIDKSGNVVVERCYIHDPRGRANSWKYSHPAGPNAVTVCSTGGTVLRCNDFIGSDPHRWNDTVESIGNGIAIGGFFRDAEIYGNMFIYSNDDGMEIEGGEMNIRVFLNKFEGSLCGISTGTCKLGPSYIFRNLITNLGDESGVSSTALKNGGGMGMGRIFFFNNTVCGKLIYNAYYKLDGNSPLLKGVTRNNIFHATGSYFDNRVFKWENDFDYDLFYGIKGEETRKLLTEKKLERHGIFDRNPDFLNPSAGIYSLRSSSPAMKKGSKVDNFVEDFNGNPPDIGAFETGKNTVLPYRPIPVYLDKYQLNFDTAKEIEQTVSASRAESNYRSDFKIRKNNVFDWFTVEPSEGTLKENITFKVRLDKNKMKKPGIYKGLFLIKFLDGYSRPVTVYADNGPLPIKNDYEGFAVYIEAEQPLSSRGMKIEDDKDASGGKCVLLEEKGEGDKEQALSYEFETPRDGDYFLFLRFKGKETYNTIFLSIDDETRKIARLFWNNPLKWMWTGCRRSDIPLSGYYEILKLNKGKHSLKIFYRNAPLYLDLIMITDNIHKGYGEY